MPSDFSAFALFVAGLASVNAYTEPTTGPSGNPIAQPSLNEIVPVGEPYSITWEPTCEGTVTILLLKGPTENVIPQFPIVELTPNDGEYTWTPGTDLEAGETGYGLQLICDATGEFQCKLRLRARDTNWRFGAQDMEKDLFRNERIFANCNAISRLYPVRHCKRWHCARGAKPRADRLG